MGVLDNVFGAGKRPSILGGGMDSIIGENARFKGELVSKGSVNVAGEFEGKLRADGEVVVSPEGKVMGEINGGTVTISGRVDGNIIARETLEVARKGRVHGDLTGGKIVIEEGSTYHGRVKVEAAQTEEEKIEASVEEPTPPPPVEEVQRPTFPNF
jgi:cytoskeletal protein CcmA (bactofilin family)